MGSQPTSLWVGRRPKAEQEEGRKGGTGGKPWADGFPPVDRALDAGGTSGPRFPQTPSFPLLCFLFEPLSDAFVVESTH